MLENMQWRLLILVLGVLVGSVIGGLPVGAEDFESGVGLEIYAVNGGYTVKVDDRNVLNNWDFIELMKVGEGEIDLAGWTVKYTRSNGTTDVLALHGVLVGEALLLRAKGSPQKDDSNFIYSFDLAVAEGKVELLYFDEVMDAVSWKSSKSADERYAREDYYPVLDAERNEWWEPEAEEDEEAGAGEMLYSQCFGLMFTELYSYFENDYDEQFVEIFNPTDEIIELNGCALRYKNKNYVLSGIILPKEYLAFAGGEMKLTKNPTSSNFMELIDITGEVVARVEWKNGQKKGLSWALIGEDEAGAEIWALSYARTPGEENIYQEFRTCPAGKVINPATGNCVNLVATATLAECGPGKFRNPETNRCKAIETAAALAPCAEGSYRNPETNRCKKIAVPSAGLGPCAEGYERNPETNRCRKIRENNGADYGVAQMSYSDKSAFMAYGALAAVATSGVLYIGFQFRKEIVKPFRLVFAKIRA